MYPTWTRCSTWCPVHGFLYVVYLVTVLDLAFRLRWSVAHGRSWSCLAGTVPFLSFVAEHRVTQRVRRTRQVTRRRRNVGETRATTMGLMDKQQEFVLRTTEERDIRFIRLWFTDVLGYLKSVAVAPAELEGAFAEGIGFDGSAIEGFARVYESDMLVKPDPTTFTVLALARRARRGPDVLRHLDAGRLAVLRRSALRAQADPESRGRHGLHVLHPP